MAGSDDDWAGNSVPWSSELPVFEPSHNLLLEAGPWTVPYSDFTPPPSPLALELRAESIEQLAGGDALRRGESERIGTCTADAVLVELIPARGNQWHPRSVSSSFAPISATTHRFGRRVGCCTASSDEMMLQ